MCRFLSKYVNILLRRTKMHFLIKLDFFHTKYDNLMAHRHKIEIFMLTLSYIIIMLNRTNIDLASHMFLAHCPNAEASLVEIKSRDRHYKHNIASSTRPRVQNKCKYECKQCIFRLDTLTLSVIATSTWLAGWLAVTLRYCIKPLNLSENFFDHLKAPSL